MVRNLVVYFSESGNTERLANLIHEQVGGDTGDGPNARPTDQTETVKAWLNKIGLNL